MITAQVVAALGQSSDLAGTVTDWLVPGRGLVKEASSATVSTTTIARSQDLRGYTVGGVPHGLGAAFTTDLLTPNAHTSEIKTALAFERTLSGLRPSRSAHVKC